MQSSTAYLDFGIDISDIDGQAYTVVVRSEVGEAREQTVFPFTDTDLEHYLLRLENAILRSTDIHRTTQSAPNDVVEQLGRALFDFILPGETRSLYNECLREAEYRHRGVRLKLSVHSPRLANLPWEFLYDPRKRDYICLNPYTPLVRYTELPQTTPPLQIRPPLRILGLLADPVDMPVRLDVVQEREQITDAVQALVERGLVELTWLEDNSWRDLQRIMRSPDAGWHIFHFIGHGGYDTLRNEGYIVLNNEDGSSHHLYASQLARMMARQRATMRLVLLNACEGARAGTQDALSSTAATLITSGIPAVLAMQYEITNDAAIEFANAFYEALADNLPVDAAVAEARNALSISNVRSLEWGVPVLHMRAVDGRLFSLQEDSAAVMPPNSILRERPLFGQLDPEQIASPTGSLLASQKAQSTVAPVSGTLPLSHREPLNAVTQSIANRLPGKPQQETALIDPLEQVAEAVAITRLPHKEATQELDADPLTSLVSAAMAAHLSGDELLHEPAKLPVGADTELESTGAQTIEQLNEALVIEASARVQGHTTALTTSTTVHQFYDEYDEEDFAHEQIEEFHHKEKPEPELDPLDINSLLHSYARRQQAFVGFQWVSIPAGYFLLGSDPRHDPHMFEDELPQLELYLESYQISQVPVTNAQYKLFIDSAFYKAPASWIEDDYPEEFGEHPVTNVSWHDAQAFCEWAGVRLPTEAEWEKAARGPNGHLYPWGDSEPDPSRCNCDLTVGTTVAVGSYPKGASPYGVLDMAGNVWEWTATPWLDTYTNYLENLAKVQDMAVRRVLRGGGFRDLEFIRCASRSWDLPNQRYRDLGFRVVAL